MSDENKKQIILNGAQVDALDVIVKAVIVAGNRQAYSFEDYKILSKAFDMLGVKFDEQAPQNETPPETKSDDAKEHD